MSQTTKPMVVALSGKMRSGKTHVADHLVEKHGFQIMRFAGPLKDDIRAMGFPGWAVQQKPDWMRLLMQAYGQARRALDSEHWVKQLILDLENEQRCIQTSLLGQHEVPRHYVIDDMRFRNEALALRNLDPQRYDVKLIRLFRLGDPGDVSHMKDVSEYDLDHWGDWDAIIQAASGDVHRLRTGIEQSLNLPHKG